MKKRTKKEIEEAHKEFFDKIWYNRKHDMFYNISIGKEPKISGGLEECIRLDMKKMEDKYGEKNMEWSDFEWGMVNGKLSALRWLDGEDWDMLDT